MVRDDFDCAKRDALVRDSGSKVMGELTEIGCFNYIKF